MHSKCMTVLVRLYDMIFIDAAKAQSKNFRVIHAFIKKRWAVVTDNVLYHGFVSNIDIVRSRNVRQMVKRYNNIING